MRITPTEETHADATRSIGRSDGHRSPHAHPHGPCQGVPVGHAGGLRGAGRRLRLPYPLYGDPEKFPFFSGRVYTPEIALPEEMASLHKALHIQRVVIVTPSVYSTDNSATLYGMNARGADARGVAVIDDQTPESGTPRLLR